MSGWSPRHYGGSKRPGSKDDLCGSNFGCSGWNADRVDRARARVSTDAKGVWPGFDDRHLRARGVSRLCSFPLWRGAGSCRELARRAASAISLGKNRRNILASVSRDDSTRREGTGGDGAITATRHHLGRAQHSETGTIYGSLFVDSRYKSHDRRGCCLPISYGSHSRQSSVGQAGRVAMAAPADPRACPAMETVPRQ